MPAQGLKRAIIILAIGLLGLGNKLLKFKILKYYKSFKLQSGKILNTLYNIPQICKGCKSRLAYIFI